MFQVGDRIKNKNQNSLFGSGIVVGLEEGDWIMVKFDQAPEYDIGPLHVIGANPCLVVKDTFENE